MLTAYYILWAHNDLLYWLLYSYFILAFMTKNIMICIKFWFSHYFYLLFPSAPLPRPPPPPPFLPDTWLNHIYSFDRSHLCLSGLWYKSVWSGMHFSALFSVQWKNKTTAALKSFPSLLGQRVKHFVPLPLFLPLSFTVVPTLLCHIIPSHLALVSILLLFPWFNSLPHISLWIPFSWLILPPILRISPSVSCEVIQKSGTWRTAQCERYSRWTAL